MFSSIKQYTMNAIAPIGEQTQSYPTAKLVKKVCPDSPLKNIQENLPFILNAMSKAGLKSRNQLIAAIATIYIETPIFKPIREYGRGGGSHGAYYGRGFIQLTHAANYKAYTRDSGIDIFANPDRALEPEIAADIFTWYWKGGARNPSIHPYAEREDWYNVRSIVNGGGVGLRGLNGVKQFLEAIERGKQYFQAGISVDTNSLPGTYGINCADGFPERVYSDIHNPSSPADAIISALGISNNDAWKSHHFEGTFNVAALPELLKLRFGRKFNLAGLGDNLDGEYLVEEALLIKNQTLEMVVEAYQKDPLAPDPIVFRHNADIPLVNPAILAQTEDISSKIRLAAEANFGRSTADGPGAGRLSCAYALGKFCILPAGLQKLGSGVYGSVAVKNVLNALSNGRGVRVDRTQAIPGDIWADYPGGDKHIGIVYESDRNGAKTILSNSSSRASFRWLDTVEKMETWYPGSGSQFWRVTS